MLVHFRTINWRKDVEINPHIKSVFDIVRENVNLFIALQYDRFELYINGALLVPDMHDKAAWTYLAKRTMEDLARESSGYDCDPLWNRSCCIFAKYYNVTG